MSSIKYFINEKILKGIAHQNAFLNYNLFKIRARYGKRGIESYLNSCKEIESDDSISDISTLKNFRREIEEGRNFVCKDPNLSNTRIYGNWYSLFGDVFDSNKCEIYSPAVEHGLIFHDQIFGDIKDTVRCAVATFSTFRERIIRKYTKIPVFCVGPYIHYAHQYYPDNKRVELKKKIGRVLLVFPAHSTDVSHLSQEEEKYCETIKTIAKNFDNVLVNSFWWNINDLLIQKLAAEGYHICSAGFRDDVHFLSRLKTIISLSDFAVGDAVGTHIGYCVCLGVPFSLLPLNTKETLLLESERKDIDFVHQHTDLISRAFLHADSITNEQKDICDKYWGLNQIKTKGQLADMCKISERLMRMCHGNTGALGEKYYRPLLKEFQETNEEKFQLLKEAVE